MRLQTRQYYLSTIKKVKKEKIYVTINELGHIQYADEMPSFRMFSDESLEKQIEWELKTENYIVCAAIKSEMEYRIKNPDYCS